MTTLHIAALVDLIVCWMLWVIPLISRARKQRHRASVETAPGGKWGVWVQTTAYFVAFLRIVRSHPLPLLIASSIIGPLSTLLVWQAMGHLGRQWRIQAGLYADHELVRVGPYRF